jgi:hypothetical protein
MNQLLRLALPLALVLGASAPAQAQRQSRPRISASFQSGAFGVSYNRGRLRISHGCRPRIRAPRHHHHSGCYSIRRQRTWVAGQRHWVSTPAQFGWIQTDCGTHWGQIAPASGYWAQDPGRYVYQNQRFLGCGH